MSQQRARHKMVSTDRVSMLLSLYDSAVHDQPLYQGTLQHLHTQQQSSRLQVCERPACSEELAIIHFYSRNSSIELPGPLRSQQAGSVFNVLQLL